MNYKELFIYWYKWSLKYKDCDPSIWMTNYLNNRFEYNEEEKYWLCWLYGNTYYLPTAWILKNEFPDFELATESRITKWNSENYKRLRYQIDTRYNKGHLPEMFVSYKKLIGNKTQKEKLLEFSKDNEERTFENLYLILNKELYKFGRYTIWFYLQHLKHTVNFPVCPNSLLLNNFEGSKSHRNGLIYATNKLDWLNTKLTEKEYDFLEQEAKEIVQEVKREFPEADFFNMETCLCSFKKLFRKDDFRWLGYYLARQKQEIEIVEKDGWYGIEWNVLWQARRETLDKKLLNISINEKQTNNFLELGIIEEPWNQKNLFDFI